MKKIDDALLFIAIIVAPLLIGGIIRSLRQPPTFSPESIAIQERAVDTIINSIEIQRKREPSSIVVPDLRNFQGLYNDPLSHAKINLGDPHENTHQVNSQVRNQLIQERGGNWNAVYVLHGKAFPVQEPPFKLQQVAIAVPVEQRGSIYSLYMQKQVPDWNNNPCYILDEWSAYLNGIECDFVAGKHDQIAYWFQCANEFYQYAQVLELLASRTQGYDSTQLHAIIEYQHQRMLKMKQYITDI